MSGLVSILSQQLAEAQAQGDLPRQVALAVALLKERNSDTGLMLAIISGACAELVAQNDPGDLTAALGWYQTWFRHTRAPDVKAGMEGLQQRITEVEEAQLALRNAIDARDATVLRSLLAGFTQNPDRVAETPALLAEARTLLEELVSSARRTWSERITRAGLMRERLMAAMPARLDVAMAVYQQLLTINPTAADDLELADLHARAEQAHTRHDQLVDALARPALQPLEQACAAVQASDDSLSETPALLQQALAELNQRRVRLEQLQTEVAGLEHSRLDRLVPVLEELAALDPNDPAGRTVSVERERLAQLEEWHQIIAQSEHVDLTALITAVDALAASPYRLADTADVLAHGQSALRRRTGVAIAKRSILVAAGLVGAALVMGVVMLVMRDREAFRAILDADDPVTALAVAERYRSEWHVFHHAAVEREIARLQNDIMEERIAEVASVVDPQERLQAIDKLLAGEMPLLRDELMALGTRTRLELADRAFAKANSVSDLSERIVALTTYANQTHDPARAQAARDTIVVVERQRDNAVWAKVLTANDPASRMAAISAYLALPNPSKAKDAERMQGQIHAEQQRMAQRTADDAAWATAAAIDDPAAGIPAIENYLAGKDRAHASAARERLKRLLIKRDEAAWAEANVSAQPPERLARLRAYLAGPVPRAFATQAQQGIVDAVWAIATSPSDPAERLLSLRAYLADAQNTAYRKEAVAMVDELSQVIDRAAWERARVPTDPGERIASIQKYLAGPGELRHRQEAEDELNQSLRGLIDSDPPQVSALPRVLLDRIPAADLLRLPAEQIDRLPPTLRARVAVPLAWATSTGVDDYGRWAVLSIGPHQIRLRYIVEGQVQVSSGAGVINLVNPAPFWLAETECTQELWSELLRGFFTYGNPSKHRGPELPVHRVSRDDCVRFITACNAMLTESGIPAQVRLPTGNEWLFVASTGNDGLAAIDRGSARSYDPRELVRLAYARENGTAPGVVGVGRRDRWGLTDLLGNVSEWCADDLDGSPHWRGGSWLDPRADCRPERMQKAKSDEGLEWVGLRLVVVPGTLPAHAPKAAR